GTLFTVPPKGPRPSHPLVWTIHLDVCTITVDGRRGGCRRGRQTHPASRIHPTRPLPAAGVTPHWSGASRELPRPPEAAAPPRPTARRLDVRTGDTARSQR